MAEQEQEAQDSETLVKDEKVDIESQINSAMRARVAHFKEQSEYSLSLSLYEGPIFNLICYSASAYMYF